MTLTHTHKKLLFLIIIIITRGSILEVKRSPLKKDQEVGMVVK